MSKTIVFQGDSITDCGRSRQSVAANTGLGGGYAYMTAAYLLCSEPEKDYQIFNSGIGGDRVVDLYARWKVDTLNFKPDILSILVGVNDTWREVEQHDGVEIDRYEMFYRMLLEWTLRELPQIKLVLMEPFVLPTGVVSPQWMPEIAARQKIVRKLAFEFDAVFIPLQILFDEALKKQADPAYWTKEGVHPLAPGPQLISQAWLQGTKHIR